MEPGIGHKRKRQNEGRDISEKTELEEGKLLTDDAQRRSGVEAVK